MALRVFGGGVTTTFYDVSFMRVLFRTVHECHFDLVRTGKDFREVNEFRNVSSSCYIEVKA